MAPVLREWGLGRIQYLVAKSEDLSVEPFRSLCGLTKRHTTQGGREQNKGTEDDDVTIEFQLRANR